MKVYDSSLLALRGVGGGQISREKRYVALEWPPGGLSSISAKWPVKYISQVSQVNCYRFSFHIHS